MDFKCGRQYGRGISSSGALSCREDCRIERLNLPLWRGTGCSNTRAGRRKHTGGFQRSASTRSQPSKYSDQRGSRGYSPDHRSPKPLQCCPGLRLTSKPSRSRYVSCTRPASRTILSLLLRRLGAHRSRGSWHPSGPREPCSGALDKTDTRLIAIYKLDSSCLKDTP
jgi:hypothetical protein